MDGTLTLHSPPGGPTVVVVRLPWQDQSVEMPNPPTVTDDEVRDATRTEAQASRDLNRSRRDIR
jgi:hypothetical protein